MRNYTRDDLDEKALRRLLSEDQLSALFDLVIEIGELLFDSVAGQGCWRSELTDDQRRIMCQRMIVRMVGELFKPEPSSTTRSSRMH